IRDSGRPSQRLHRCHGATFDDYCRTRWGMTERNANYLISAAEVVECLKTGTTVPVLPGNERQARELARLADEAGVLDADRVVAAWERVVERSESEGVPVTAKLVRAEVDTSRPGGPAKPPRDFDMIRELKEIHAWLCRRREKWPGRYAPSFINHVRRQLDNVESDDDGEGREGVADVLGYPPLAPPGGGQQPPPGPGRTVSDLRGLIAAGERVGTISAAPPWPYRNTASRGAAANHYQTMSLDAIAALPVRELASENAHLHLWVPVAFHRDAYRILEAWGFEFASEFVWTKP